MISGVLSSPAWVTTMVRITADSGSRVIDTVIAAIPTAAAGVSGMPTSAVSVSPPTSPMNIDGKIGPPRKPPREIAQEKGLIQVQDAGAVEAAVDAVLAANPGEVEKYRAGKKQVFGFLVGQVMKAMKGKGNPALVNAALKAKLGE